MKTLVFTSVAVCAMGWFSPGWAQGPDSVPPAIELPVIERLPPTGTPAIPNAPIADALVPNQHPVAPPAVDQPLELVPPDAPPEVLAPPDAAAPVDEVVAEEVEEVVKEEVVEKSPWSGSIELGANGSSGNSNLYNVRFGLDLDRKTDWTKFSFDFDYKNDSTDHVRTANRLFLDLRQEWAPTPGPWNLYVHGTTEYDEFKDFDTRIAADSGLTYNFLKTDKSRFAGRMGLGVSHEIGGTSDEWVPEGSLGLDLERKISKFQKFKMKVDYFPDLSDFGDSRVDTKVNYETVIDADMNLSLKLGVRDRYDSTPGTAQHNDLDYSVVLLWKF
jgi:putative salt-induced outer membrane protein YdiY